MSDQTVDLSGASLCSVGVCGGRALTFCQSHHPFRLLSKIKALCLIPLPRHHLGYCTCLPGPPGPPTKGPGVACLLSPVCIRTFIINQALPQAVGSWERCVIVQHHSQNGNTQAGENATHPLLTARYPCCLVRVSWLHGRPGEKPRKRDQGGSP